MALEQSFFDFCAKITSTTSTNEKKKIISEYADDMTVTHILKFLYDKNRITGISKQKLNKEANGIDSIPIHYICELINYFDDHHTGRDADVATCREYLMYMHDVFECNTAQLKVLSQIITKSLKLGIDTKLVNTVIPGLIPVHEVQQAYSLKDHKLKDGEWFCLSQKMNGNRATYVDGKLLSRQGKEFTNLDHILSELNYLNNHIYNGKMVFDGEIIRRNIDNVSDNENFRIGTGILNSDSEDKSQLNFVIFDMLPKDEFLNGESINTYKYRMNEMKNLNAILYDTYEYIEVVPFLYEGTDQSMISVCLMKMDEEGKEGCMLARDVPYRAKRHNGILKVKSFYTLDLKVVGMEPGTGKYENTLGNLIVDFKGNQVGVGSGFTDYQRNEIWCQPNKYIGKIVEIKYKEITKDKITGKESLQFPVFVQFRDDKSDISYS